MDAGHPAVGSILLCVGNARGNVSWRGNQAHVSLPAGRRQGGEGDISKFGQAWNITGFYSRNYALGKDFAVFWGLLTGYGLKGVELVKSRSIDSGESRVIDRNLDEGFIFGLSAGMGYSL